MGKLTDILIRTWIRNNEHFAGHSDGNGLYIFFPKSYSGPFWRFRYKMAGKARIMLIDYYPSISLVEALEKMEEEKHTLRVSELAAEYFERQILDRWKHPDILRRLIDKDINLNIGHFRIEEVKAWRIDDML